jgi:hypothetical protein
MRTRTAIALASTLFPFRHFALAADGAPVDAGY